MIIFFIILISPYFWNKFTKVEVTQIPLKLYYENKNIILMENLNKISKTLFPLKDKLEVEININKKITNDKEIKELLSLFEKQKLKNEIL